MDASKLMSLMADKKQAMAKRDKTVKPKDGSNRIVLLQGWEKGAEHVWFHNYGQHFIKNSAGDMKAVYVCTESTFDKPCAVCAALADAARSAPDDATLELLGEAKGGKRILINALVLDGDKPNEPMIYEIAPTVFGQLVDLIDEWGIKAFTHEIVLNRSGKGLGTKYTVQVSPKEFEVSPSIIAKIHNLAEYAAQESDEQEKRALTAIGAISGRLPSMGAPAGTLSALPGSASAGEAVASAEAGTAAEEKALLGSGQDLDDLLSEMP